jgi:site-specific DNA-methyltransferase (adenine-specific)
VRIQSASEAIALEDDLVIEGDNLAALDALPELAFDLVYMDPPFNTGRAQRRGQLAVERTADPDAAGGRIGVGGHRYTSTLLRTLTWLSSSRA